MFDVNASVHSRKQVPGRILETAPCLRKLAQARRAVPDDQHKKDVGKSAHPYASSVRKFVSCKHALTNCAERRSGAGHAVPDVCASVHRHPDSSTSVPVEVFSYLNGMEHSTAPQYECKLALIHGDAAEAVYSCFCISASLHWCRNTAAKHGDALI
jgi:hypothetical protein